MKFRNDYRTINIESTIAAVIAFRRSEKHAVSSAINIGHVDKTTRIQLGLLRNHQPGGVPSREIVSVRTIIAENHFGLQMPVSRTR